MSDFGIVNVYKPVGMTSFSAVRRIRHIFSVKKAGHCGTLDPFASGVLPVCIGKATRIVRYMDDYDKTYRCTMIFGKSTDTMDSEGVVVDSREPDPDLWRSMASSDYSDIRSSFSHFMGELWQTPPMYSALKVKGRPLYSYAREGIELDIQPRKIVIHSLSVERIYYSDVLRADFFVSCSKGTYIRKICHDIGLETGLLGYAEKLERTSCGPFSTKNSYTPDELEVLLENGELRTSILPENVAVSHFPRIDLAPEEAVRIRLGQRLPTALFAERLSRYLSIDDFTDSRVAAYEDGALVCIFRTIPQDGELQMKIERVFA